MSFGKRAPWTVNINSILHQQILYSTSLNVYWYIRKIIDHDPSVVPGKSGRKHCMGFCFKNSIWKCKDFLPQSELVRAPMKKTKVKNFKPYCSFSASITLKQTYFIIKLRYTILNKKVKSQKSMQHKNTKANNYSFFIYLFRYTSSVEKKCLL